MRLLLVQPLSWLFAAGGAHKANRYLFEGLAARGHECHVYSPIELSRDGSETDFSEEGTQEALIREVLREGGDVLDTSEPQAVIYRLNGVTVHAVAHDLPVFSRGLASLLRSSRPHWTVVSEDRSSLWLQLALEERPGRVVYLSHSQATLPFGPEAFEVDFDKERVYRRAAGIITVSSYLQDYVYRWAGLPSEVLRFPSYGTGPYPNLGRFDSGAVGMINPAVIKGSSIFIRLAQDFPHVDFAVVPSWGTSLRERTVLESLPNVSIVPRSPDMNSVLSHFRVLLVPSLWGESFGQVCIDALLRGIPVMASNIGGLPEATLGAGVLLPVRPVSGYRIIRDTKTGPIPIVPPQDSEPWRVALEHLLGDRTYYEQLSRQGYAAAAAFVSTLGIQPFEDYFLALEGGQLAAPQETHEEAPRGQLAGLSPERRVLVARRLAAQAIRSSP